MNGWWFNVRWSAIRCWYNLFHRVSLLSVSIFFIVGQAIGIIASPPVRIIVSLLVVGYSSFTFFLRSITKRSEQPLLYCKREKRFRVVVSLSSCVLLGLITVSKRPIVAVAPQSEVGLRGIVTSLRRSSAGAVQFRISAYRQNSLAKGGSRSEENSPLNLLCRAAALPWRWASKLAEGDEIFFVASIKPLRLSQAGFGYEDSLARSGIDASCSVNWLTIPSLVPDGAIEHSSKIFDDRKGRNYNEIGPNPALPTDSKPLPQIIGDIVTDVVGNTEAAALLLSMTIGTRDRLSKDTEELFRYFGLAHLLVISGYQLSQLIRVMGAFVRSTTGLFWRQVDRFPLGILPPLISLGSGLALGAMVGFEVSITRAIVGVVLIEVIKSAEGIKNMGHSLLVTALIMSGLWPGVLFEPAGALTMSALSGILIGSAIGGSGWRGVIGAHCGALLLATLVAMIWFPPPNVVAAILVAPFAALFAIIILYGTVVGISVNTLGIDPHGLCLRAVATIAEAARHFLWWVQL